MAITDDLRKTLSNSTPLYFAAGTVDLAAEKLRTLPATFDKLREQAPERLQAVREVELPRLREQAQTLALQGAGLAIEYAVKARETYDELAERGKEALEGRRAEKNGEDAPEVTVERAGQSAPFTEPVTEPVTEPFTEPAAEPVAEPAAESVNGAPAAEKAAEAAAATETGTAAGTAAGEEAGTEAGETTAGPAAGPAKDRKSPTTPKPRKATSARKTAPKSPRKTPPQA